MFAQMLLCSVMGEAAAATGGLDGTWPLFFATY